MSTKPAKLSARLTVHTIDGQVHVVDLDAEAIVIQILVNSMAHAAAHGKLRDAKLFALSYSELHKNGAACVNYQAVMTALLPALEDLPPDLRDFLSRKV